MPPSISQACCYEATRFRRKIGARSHPGRRLRTARRTPPLTEEPIDQAAGRRIEEKVSGLFITGHDYQSSMARLRAVRPRSGERLLFSARRPPPNVAEALTVADGAAVATWIKHGDMRNPVNPERARQFVAAVRRAERA